MVWRLRKPSFPSLQDWGHSGRSSRSVLCLNNTVLRTMIVAFLDIIILSAQASHLNDNSDDGTASLLPVYERGFA